MGAAWPWRLVLLLVALAPLPFGSNRPWAWSLGALLAGIALIGWAAVTSPRRGWFWHPALWPSAIGFGAALLWAMAQMLPAAPQAVAHPLWPMAAQALGTPVRGSISIVPDLAPGALLRLASYGAIFWLALQYGRDRRRAHELVVLVAAASLIYALYGLANYMAGNQLLLWFPRWAYTGDVTGTFVNRNSYATFAGLGLLAAMVQAIRTFRDNWRVADRSLPPLPRAVDSFIGWPLVWSLAGAVIAMAWLQSHSRMGFAATLVGIVALLLALRAAGMVRNLALVAAAGLAGLTILILTSGAMTLERLDQIQVEDRLPLFALVVEGIRNAPWTGHGLGSFPALFPMFRDLTLAAPANYSQAHNSYLELAFDLGIPAAAALVGAVIWAAFVCLAGVVRRRRDRVLPALAFAGAMLVGVHALVDFSLQIPAVAYVFAALLGVGVAQSWSPDEGGRAASRAAAG